ncbi:protein disulfide oxidoreductase [Halanaerobium praevalens]|uniref:Glutaredoxin-like domain protein n=1 Tax=Halanaerobium praevalens (strain ATCC 33744 / DSM 2228 / GSL) TaxID=572479 RepID=E3DRP9_HALPG|nr:thioredoxin family protein [Halanaerobium praevalens]ADO78113.1 glutaredoxin-like domain protein [Halanaerobium praevalens DSM 2228]
MAKIDREEKNKIKNLFANKLKDEVKLLFFAEAEACQYCADTEEILSELTALDEKVNYEKYSLASSQAEEFKVDKVPAIVILDQAGQDLGIRFYGIPSGYEFTSLVEDIIDVSDQENIDLKAKIKAEIKAIDFEVLLQVFITPTCPYCPRAVRAAHQMAILNPKIRGEMIEAMEFEELTASFDVAGVPKTVINSGAAEQVGAVPAKTILKKIKALDLAVK